MKVKRFFTTPAAAAFWKWDDDDDDDKQAGRRSVARALAMNIIKTVGRVMVFTMRFGCASRV